MVASEMFGKRLLRIAASVPDFARSGLPFGRPQDQRPVPLRRYVTNTDINRSHFARTVHRLPPTAVVASDLALLYLWTGMLFRGPSGGEWELSMRHRDIRFEGFGPGTTVHPWNVVRSEGSTGQSPQPEAPP